MDFAPDRIDRAWLHAWLEGRSLARGVPLPCADRGGWRVETGSAAEIRRWVFASISRELIDLAHEPLGPGHALRASVSPEHMRANLPDVWSLGAISFTMVGPKTVGRSGELPNDFRLELRSEGPVTRAFVLDGKGRLAASGHGGSGSKAYVYDRIVTQEEYRRLGLGRAVMAALRSAKPDPYLPDLLVATEAGRSLYESMGWTTLGPYASASWS